MLKINKIEIIGLRTLKSKMNRKQRKKRKMQLKRQGLEAYILPPNAIITTSPLNFPHKIAKHFNGLEIQVRKMKGYEFLRSLKKVK